MNDGLKCYNKVSLGIIYAYLKPYCSFGAHRLGQIKLAAKVV